MINKDYSNKKFPVEYLIFEVENTELVDKFVKLDHEIWTEYLSAQPGFISKEVWINYDNPGEVHTILIWETLDAWKSISLDELKAKDKEFNNTFGGKFEMVRRIHRETNHGLHKVRHYELEKEL